MVEKRSEPRIDVAWPLHVAGICEWGEGRSINVSLSGVSFATNADFALGDLVVLRIAPDADTSIDCVAEIVRADNRGGDKSYGAAFRYLSAADRKRLNLSLLAARQPMVASLRDSR